MKEIHAELPFPCDYVRNGYCKRVIILTAFISENLHINIFFPVSIGPKKLEGREVGERQFSMEPLLVSLVTEIHRSVIPHSFYKILHSPTNHATITKSLICSMKIPFKTG